MIPFLFPFSRGLLFPLVALDKINDFFVLIFLIYPVILFERYGIQCHNLYDLLNNLLPRLHIFTYNLKNL